jgi:hypothetical protein
MGILGFLGMVMRRKRLFIEYFLKLDFIDIIFIEERREFMIIL